MVRVTKKTLNPRTYVFDGVPKDRRHLLSLEIARLRRREIEAECAERGARLARSRAAAAARAAGVVRQAKERDEIMSSEKYKKMEKELKELMERRELLGKRMKVILERENGRRGNVGGSGGNGRNGKEGKDGKEGKGQNLGRVVQSNSRAGVAPQSRTASQPSKQEMNSSDS